MPTVHSRSIPFIRGLVLVGAEFETKEMVVDGYATKLLVFDTMGNDRFRANLTYYRRKHIAIICYDISCRATFASASGYYHDIIDQADEGVVVALFGLKTDLAEQEQVTAEEAAQWAEECSSKIPDGPPVLSLRMSSKTSDNVERAFDEVVYLAVSRCAHALPPIGSPKAVQLPHAGSLDEMNKTKSKGWCGS